MDAAAASTPTRAASQPPRGSFDDVYRANGSGLLSAASSSSLSLSAVGDKPQSLLLDDDAVMSGGDENDAMSETSSLGMDASDSDSAALAAIALDANDAMDLLLDDHDQGNDATEYSMARKPRPASFHGLSHSTSPSSSHNRPHQPPPHHAPLARASSLDETFSSSSSPFGSSPSTTLWGIGTSTTNNNYWNFSPRKRKRKIMLLHCRFASAMSKSVARDVSSPHPQLLEGQADDLMDGARSSSNSRHAQDENHAFAKVEWAHSESVQDDRHGVHLVAARNQVVGAQLRLLSNAPFQLTTDRTNWFLAQGHAPRARVHVETAYLPQAIHVEVLLIGCVEDENGDRVMETLEKRTSSQALAVEHALYIRVRVGDVAIAGAYEIPVRVFTQHAGFTDEELSWTTNVTVRVASVTLPPPSQSHFHLDLWQHHSAVARAHGGVPLWSDAHFTLLDRYVASLAELGQKCLTVVATEMPWAGQQCYSETAYPSPLYEHAVLDVYEDDTGCGLQIDFQHFDRLVALAESHDMASEIEVFGLFSIWRDPANGFDSPVEATPSVASSSSSSAPPLPSAAPPVDLARKPSVSDETKPLDSWRIRCVHRTTQRVRYLRSMAEIERFLSLFHAHCVERQLVDRVRVCADEPSDLPAFYQQMDFLERLAPRFRVKVALNNLAFLQHAPPQVVDFVPLLPLVCADLELTHRWRRHIHEVQHGRFCWYVCCGPAYPNQFVSSPLCETELVGFLTHFLGLDGFLRWNFCLWPAKPWESLAWRSPNWKVGDMYFVLPGHDGFPVETLRYEGMRFAVQSFELLRLAETRLPAPEFERLRADVASLVWRAPGHAQFGKYLESPGSAPEDLYSLDPEDYEQARRLLIDALALVESMEPASSVNTPPPVERDTLLSPRRENNPPTSPRKRSFHGP